jgi:hypothetical protein
MKTTVKIEGTICAKWEKWSKEYFHRFIQKSNDDYKLDEWAINEGYFILAPYTIVIELSKGFDYKSATLKGLQNKRKLILASNEIRIQDIDAEIQEFLAIENKS